MTMTRTLAYQLHGGRLPANGISPGTMGTPRVDAPHKDGASGGGHERAEAWLRFCRLAETACAA